MRKRLSYKEQRQQMQLAREIEMTSMEHYEPISAAKLAFKRKPYESVCVREYIKKIRKECKR